MKQVTIQEGAHPSFDLQVLYSIVDHQNAFLNRQLKESLRDSAPRDG